MMGEMKKIVVILTIVLLLSTSTVGMGLASQAKNRSFLEKQNNILNSLSAGRQNIITKLQSYRQRASNIYGTTPDDIPDNFEFSPEDIKLKDDAFHGANTLHFTEWWYFDAAFDNGYSAQLSVRVLGALNPDIVFSRLDIYRFGSLLYHKQKLHLFNEFYASSTIPVIELDGKQVMKGYIDEITGDWIYDLSFDFDDASADLRFIGNTKGWKGQLHGSDWWGVILPRAQVTGIIKVDNNKIDVTGIGYHDHNWEVTVFAGINFGWFWGKINSDSYTMTWSNVMTTRLTSKPILVINMNDDGYLNINPEDILFTVEDFRFNRGMLVPYSFTLIVQNSQVSLHVEMEVFDVHHDRLMGITNYWRYHVRCTGSIKFASHTETIDEIQIAEFIRFR